MRILIYQTPTRFHNPGLFWDIMDCSSLFSVDRNTRARRFNNDEISYAMWNTSGCTSMNEMFRGASLFNQNLSVWDVSSVTDTTNMFMSARSFNQDISTWDVSNVRKMFGMLFVANSFNQDISMWDVSSATDM